MAIIPTSGEFTKVPEGGGNVDNRFVVMLTPTADDVVSGTMDKTPAEIDGAWNSGKSIWFSIADVGFMMPMSQRQVMGEDQGGGVKYFAHAIMDGELLSVITSTSGKTYDAEIYQLTPMGS